MSLKLGTQDIAGISQNTKYNAHHLLDFKWSDCIMNDVSWLRADTFSWQSGDVYTSAYNHLVADLQGTTAETETIGSYTVTFYRADDGHKICLADQETTVLNIYNESGIAWYYIVDTVNTRFKLPRTKFGFEGLRSNVGDNIEAGLPNITGSIVTINNNGDCTETGAIKYTSGQGTSGKARVDTVSSSTGGIARISFDASLSNSIYGNSTTVQPPATQMYLYFYVGDYSQTAIEQTAGLNSGLFNGKADVDLTNVNNSGTSTGASWAMPSDTYDDLTLGANGAEYTAPANGYFEHERKLSTGTGMVGLTNVTTNVKSWVYIPQANSTSVVFVPAQKGDTIQIALSGTASSTALRFIYAQGSESEAS